MEKIPFHAIFGPLLLARLFQVRSLTNNRKVVQLKIEVVENIEVIDYRCFVRFLRGSCG